jgi:hypothetical protein
MTQFNAPTYDIERPTGRCAFTGKPLEPGEDYMATLIEAPPPPEEEAGASKAATAGEQTGLKRLDVSMAAWEEGQRPDRLFSHWRATVPHPNEKKKLFVDNDVLLQLFRRLGDADQLERLAFRFVLGLILMRKKMLRYDGTTKKTAPGSTPGSDGQVAEQDYWLMTPKLDVSKGPLGKWDDEGTMLVLDPHLDDERIQQVTEQLGEILEAEL